MRGETHAMVEGPARPRAVPGAARTTSCAKPASVGKGVVAGTSGRPAYLIMLKALPVQELNECTTPAQLARQLGARSPEHRWSTSVDRLRVRDAGCVQCARPYSST